MKLARKVGATSQIFQVFIQNSGSTTGAGLTGLVFNTASLIAYYHRDTDTTATAISLVTMTAGTFTSSGFVEIDATHMPGWYQFCPPNAALASGAASVGFHLQGAANMAPLPIEVDLDAQVDVTFWNGTVVATPATAGIPDVNVKNVGGQTATAAAGVTFPSSIASPTNITAGTITTVGGNVAGSVGSVTAAVTVDGTSALTESYAAAGAGFTLAQALYGLTQQIGAMSITGTTMTVFKRNGVTTAKTYTLNNASTPSAITEST